MTKGHDSVAKGVTDAWDFWLSQHDISTPETIQRAIFESFQKWASDNEEGLIQGISKAIAAENPVAGHPVAVYAVGSVVSIYAAEPGWEVITYLAGGEGLERFPVTAWAVVVYELDDYDRPKTRIEPMFICNGYPALQTAFSDCEIRKVGHA